MVLGAKGYMSCIQLTEVGFMSERSSSVVKTGIGFGCCLAMIISWSIHQSVLFALFHGVLGWFYIIWYLLFIR
jgi:hypothetical protein